MTLSTQSINQIADQIAPEVFHIIQKEPAFNEAVMNALPRAIDIVLGEVSPTLVGKLGCEIIDRIGVEGGCCDECDKWRGRYEALYRYVKTNYAESYVDGVEYGYGYGYEDVN